MQLVEDLRSLLLSRKATSQEDICAKLEKLGHDINQSKVSRLLRKVGAIKVINSKGVTVYSLPKEPGPPSTTTILQDLITDISCNEALIVILTSPGSASMIARILDHHEFSVKILGTIAGDDTIFVTPISMQKTKKLFAEIKALLFSSHRERRKTEA